MPFPIVLILSFFFLLFLHLWLHQRQPLPYMDELFHVPQAAAFCKSFRLLIFPSYDPSITTLPGLYLPPAILHFLTLGLVPCSTRILRLFSAASSLLSLPASAAVLSALRRRARRGTDSQWLSAFALWLHPVALFYALLYYTDAPAAFCVLLAWRAALRGRHIWSTFAGLAATLTRQTNMVWHAYVAADSAVELVLGYKRTKRGGVVKMMREICGKLWPHALAGCLYLLFLVVNGGPAVGDKTHHAPSAQWAMLPYFLGFHAVSYLPFQLGSPNELIAQVRLLMGSRTMYAVVTTVCALLTGMVLATGDRVHAFVLADNRHYVFYIYRRWLLRSTWRRLVLVPVYAWGALGPLLELAILQAEGGEKREEAILKRERAAPSETLDWDLVGEQMRDVLLLLCATATLIPSPLLEPRYFSVASTILSMRRLARRKVMVPTGSLIVIVMLFLTVNIALVYVFAELPFDRPVDPHMPNDLSPGRFMF